MFEFDQYINEFTQIPVAPAKPLWVAEYRANTIHSQGVYPKKRIGNRRPYEPEEVHKFREENFAAITKDSYGRALNDLQRVITRGGVSYSIPRELADILDQPIFEGTNYWVFQSERKMRRMIEDPNGITAWWPIERPAGESEPVRIKPIMIFSRQIHHLSDEYITWLSDEKSPVTVGRKIQNSGTVHYTLTKTQAWKRIQVGIKSDNKYKWELVYNHDFGFLPAYVFKGEQTTKVQSGEEYSFWESYFAGARAFLDECLAQFSDHQGSMVTCSFPIREMKGIPCPNKCVDGWVYDQVEAGKETNATRRKCTTCGGRGSIVPSSPYGVLLRNDNLDNPDQRDVPAMRFIQAETSMLELSGNYWQTLLEKGEKALSLLFIENAQSAIAKDIDREGKYSKLDRIGINVWEHQFRTDMKAIYGYYFPGKELVMSIALPTTFRERTEKEMLEELGILREKGAPSFLTSAVTEEIVRKRYPGDRTMQKKLEVLSVWDPLFGYDRDRIEMMLASSSITELDSSRSVYAPSILNKLHLMDPEAFLTNDITSIIALAEAELLKMMPAPVTQPIGKDGKPVV